MRFFSLIICLCLCACTLNTPKRGQKIGHIVKLAKEGVFNQTWEGELIRGSMQDGSGSFGQVFHFTIEDSKNYFIAQQALEANKEVIIHYRSELIAAYWRSESSEPHFVDSIEVK